MVCNEAHYSLDDNLILVIIIISVSIIYTSLVWKGLKPIIELSNLGVTKFIIQYILAITWGLIHIFTQGTSTGIYAVIQALLYGSDYMVLNKDYKISYAAIALMFML